MDDPPHPFDIAFLEGIQAREPEETRVLEMLAGLYTRAGRLDDGLALDRQLVNLQPENATHRYNLACSLALKNRPDEAIATLKEAISLGYDDFKWMRKDPDLKGLRAHPAFVNLLAEQEISQ